MRLFATLVLFLGACENPGQIGAEGRDGGIDGACADGERQDCYSADPATAGVGACVAGARICDGGAWGPCEGEVVPREETCDETDDDCDGETDEDLLNACGTCGSCACTGPQDGCDDWDEDTSFERTAEGWLTPNAPRIGAHVIWPASTDTGRIFKVNTETYEIEGAYFTGPDHVWDSPSPVAVDATGAAIVANRAFTTSEGSLTKIAATEADCEDRDGSGDIATSTGLGDALPFDGFGSFDDECILWNLPVEAATRTVALRNVPGLDGSIETRGWVGLSRTYQFLEFDAESGELTGEDAPTDGNEPFGMAIDPDGIAWVTLLGSVARFDTDDPSRSFETIAIPGGESAESVTVDENGIVWFGGMNALRYDPAADEFDVVYMPETGAAQIVSDGVGGIWAGSFSYQSHVYRISNDDDLTVEQVETPSTDALGAAVDFDGHVWFLGMTTGNASVVDVDSHAVEVALDDCGGPCLGMTYIVDDMSGYQLVLRSPPSASWNRVYEGCPGGAGTPDWKKVVLDAETPEGTRITARVATADEMVDLDVFVPIGTLPPDGPELDLDEALPADAAFLDLAITLEGTPAARPVLRSVEVQWECR
jgi:streptogramin lyase